MLDLSEMRMRAEEVGRDADRGYDALPMRTALADLAIPLLQLIEIMEDQKGGRWYFVEEVMGETGWSRKWFDKKQKSLGDRSRLEVWRDEKLAHQAENGIWLISPARVPPRKPGYVPPAGEGAVEEGAEETGQTGRNGVGMAPHAAQLANEMLEGE